MSWQEEQDEDEEGSHTTQDQLPIGEDEGREWAYRARVCGNIHSQTQTRSDEGNEGRRREEVVERRDEEIIQATEFSRVCC